MDGTTKASAGLPGVLDVVRLSAFLPDLPLIRIAARPARGAMEKLGEFQRWRGSPEPAEQSQREALRPAERAGDLRAQTRLRRTLAETLGYLRRPEEAAPLLESAIRDFRALNDRRREGAGLYALGKIYCLLSRRQEAIERHDRAEETSGDG